MPGSPRTVLGSPRDVHDNIYGHGKRLRWILEQLHPKQRIIELGCGTGYMITLPLAQRGFSVQGVDLDEASIQLGRRIFAEHGVATETLQAVDLAAMEPVDVIIASEVLEHNRDEELTALLDCIRSRLQASGLLLVTVPNGYGWFELESFLWYRLGLGRLIEFFRIDRVIRHLRRRLAGSDPSDDPPSTLCHSPHVQRFTRRSIQQRLTQAGFEVVGCVGSVLFAGPFSNLLFADVHPVMRLNHLLGTWFPDVAAGFYVACKPRTGARSKSCGTDAQ